MALCAALRLDANMLTRIQKDPRAKVSWEMGLEAESEKVQITNFLCCQRQFSYILSSEEKAKGADNVCQSCRSARRA